jgi:GTP-binding protein
MGLPNAGKSTLLARISAARPKIAEYPFTTLEPYLGVVSRDNGLRSLVFADIPGLIEGAHAGAGLGHRFLRHIERCRLLLHLVDLADPEPVDRRVQTLNEELVLYDPTLATRTTMLVGTKADAVSDPSRPGELAEIASELGVQHVVISAVSGEGVEGMLEAVFALAERG